MIDWQSKIAACARNGVVSIQIVNTKDESDPHSSTERARPGEQLEGQGFHEQDLADGRKELLRSVLYVARRQQLYCKATRAVSIEIKKSADRTGMALLLTLGTFNGSIRYMKEMTVLAKQFKKVKNFSPVIAWSKREVTLHIHALQS